MTTLVIVKKGGLAAIAADTLHIQGTCRVLSGYQTRPSKLVRVGKSIVGVPGSTAGIRVMESLARQRTKALCLNSINEIFETFRALHRVLVDDYHLLVRENDDAQPYESSQLNLLIANSSGIYELQSYREVVEYERFWATGTGFKYALGALEVLYEDPRLGAEEIARRAVEISCTFDDASAAPVESQGVKLRRGKSGRPG